MKVYDRILLLVLFVLGLVLVAPVMAQGDEPVVFGSQFIDGSIVSWVGWIVAVILGALLLVAVRELAAAGNKSAELGLRFFEAGRDMVPIESWQSAYERRAAGTPTLIDDYIARGTRQVLTEAGVIPRQEIVPAGSLDEANPTK